METTTAKNRLRRLREQLGLSQRQLARELGVASGAVAQWETGKRRIPAPISKLARAYETALGAAAPDGLATGWLSRSLKLSLLGAKVAAGMTGAYLMGERDREDERPELLAVAAALGSLKGVAMKFGQMLSYTDEALTEESRAVLWEILHSQPMDAGIIEEVLTRELGSPPAKLFAEWSRKPLAAATIGQVHWARLKSGAEVAVKVQYPGIEDAIRADLKNVKALSLLARAIYRAQSARAFVEEIRDRFLEECDYRLELQNQDDVARALACHEDIAVPRVYPELTTARVLVTEYRRGRSFDEFLRTSAQDEKNRAAQAIFRASFHGLIRHAHFNADAHPGNYLFEDGKVVLLDFGCFKRLEMRAHRQWLKFFRATLDSDMTALKDAVRDLRIDRGRRPFDYRYFLEMFRFASPWTRPGKFKYDYDFLREVQRAVIRDNPNKDLSSLPRDWIFMYRLTWSMNSMMAMLEAEADWGKIMRELLEEPGARHSAETKSGLP